MLPIHMSIINSGFTNCLFVLGFFCPLVCQFFIAGTGGNGDVDNMLFCLVF